MTAEDEPKTEPEVAEDEDVELEIYSLKVLPVTHDLHQKHGLRHADYQR
jgi:hypothetical protein